MFSNHSEISRENYSNMLNDTSIFPIAAKHALVSRMWETPIFAQSAMVSTDGRHYRV